MANTISLQCTTKPVGSVPLRFTCATNTDGTKHWCFADATYTHINIDTAAFLFEHTDFFILFATIKQTDEQNERINIVVLDCSS
mmetsp:Transcript_4264/g.9632  ORF Transcript_4264/g.9632 Transcript_4264/m.9632 type:complete len:84 (-) Transcript_4264:177-428(-)